MSVILFCDDNATIQKLFAAALALSGHRVLLAGSGEEALRLIEETRPDLVVTDRAMPGMSGIELLRRIREQAELADVPVVILSASTDASHRDQAAAAGAAAYLVKPFSPDAIVRTIESLLRRRRDLEST